MKSLNDIANWNFGKIANKIFLNDFFAWFLLRILTSLKGIVEREK